jgi:hypothetical protein
MKLPFPNNLYMNCKERTRAKLFNDGHFIVYIFGSMTAGINEDLYVTCIIVDSVTQKTLLSTITDVK